VENSIIAIDDEMDFLESVRRGLIISGFNNVMLVDQPKRAVNLFKEGNAFDLALIDVAMPEVDGVDVLNLIKSTSPGTECLMVTAVNEARVAVECLKKGAYDYLVKPVSREDLVAAVKRALERKRLIDIIDLDKKPHPPKLTHEAAFTAIVTKSAKILKILKEAELHAISDVPILLTGESGTGKELLARAIHDASSRAGFPFQPINMASLTGSLFDAEFFGHSKGAFTGAEKDRAGYLEYANRGTLFLDEVGNLPLDLQGKLLRVLQNGEFLKIGTSTIQKADVRFIAATNTDLDKLMAQGKFRKDLYYRLKGAWLHLPPLREREADIPLLINKFLKEFCRDSGSCGIEQEAISILRGYDYPGNIRELKSIVQSAVNLSQGEPISAETLPGQLQKIKPKAKHAHQAEPEPIVPLSEVEKIHILKVYDRTNRTKSRTAQLLGIGLSTLRRKLRAYGVD